MFLKNVFIITYLEFDNLIQDDNDYLKFPPSLFSLESKDYKC